MHTHFHDPPPLSFLLMYQNKFELQKFLGLASYYSLFVPTVAQFLHHLTEKGYLISMKWGMSKCQCTLKKLNRLTTTLILALPSISCILLPMPILSKQERNYCVICHKLPGAVFFTDHFWEYRLGRQFLLSMHHSWLQQVKEPQGQLACLRAWATPWVLLR